MHCGYKLGKMVKTQCVASILYDFEFNASSFVFTSKNPIEVRRDKRIMDFNIPEGRSNIRFSRASAGRKTSNGPMLDHSLFMDRRPKAPCCDHNC